MTPEILNESVHNWLQDCKVLFPVIEYAHYVMIEWNLNIIFEF